MMVIDLTLNQGYGVKFVERIFYLACLCLGDRITPYGRFTSLENTVCSQN